MALKEFWTDLQFYDQYILFFLSTNLKKRGKKRKVQKPGRYSDVSQDAALSWERDIILV